MTLTFNNQAPDPLVDPKYYSLAWNTFLKRLRRKYPTLKFARIVELTQSGRPHFHVLIDRYIPQRYVSWAFAQCGGGKIADCRLVDPGRAGQYITKYVTKTFDPDSGQPYFFFITRMRSISTSRNLYYIVPHFGRSTMCISGLTESCTEYMKHQMRFAFKNVEYYFNDNGRDPPLLFFPRDRFTAPEYDPYIEPLLTLRQLQIWSLDLRELPDPSQVYIHFPPAIPPAYLPELRSGSMPENLLLSR